MGQSSIVFACLFSINADLCTGFVRSLKADQPLPMLQILTWISHRYPRMRFSVAPHPLHTHPSRTSSAGALNFVGYNTGSATSPTRRAPPRPYLTNLETSTERYFLGAKTYRWTVDQERKLCHLKKSDNFLYLSTWTTSTWCELFIGHP